ncbi:MAG TPA: hypothetical protein VHF67_02680 [Gaiellaceae bacterium]|nr:hypothetical protein [Gaiellaceae bacterium]
MRRLVVVVALGAGALASLVPTAAAQRPRTWNTRPVGHVELRGGFNGDVAVHRRAAYVGSWGFAGLCPVHGVRAISVRRPTRPRVASRFARFPATTAEDVWVGAIETPFFRGDLAAVGIQRCRPGARFAGLALFDVTRPGRPRLLGRLASERGVRGVHELSVVQRADGRVLALLAVPHSLLVTEGRKGDVRIVDVTNPRAPQELADWDFRRDGPEPDRSALVSGRGSLELYAHSVAPYAAGQRAFVSHWDAGTVFLDLADPARPLYLGRTAYGSGAHGNAHSGAFTPGETVFVQNDEVGDFYGTGSERGSWGFQRIFDVSNPGAPVEIGRFATESSIPGRDRRIRRDGLYSVHNNVIVGRLEVVSWYSDGVRIVSLRNPRRPRTIGFFIPPPRRDPQRFWRAPNGAIRFPQVWGIAVRGDLVYASDINSGLWIFRARALRDPG